MSDRTHSDRTEPHATFSGATLIIRNKSIVLIGSEISCSNLNHREVLSVKWGVFRIPEQK